MYERVPRMSGKYRPTQELIGLIIGVYTTTKKCKVQIPKEVKKGLGIQGGEDVVWVKHPDGRYYILKNREIG